MKEGEFKPNTSATTPENAVEIETEKFRKGLMEKIEKIDNIDRLTLIMQRFGINMDEPFSSLSIAKEAVQTFIRGFNKSQLETLQAVVRQIEEGEENL